MRIVLAIGTGVVAGYFLHTKKDQSIESLVTGLADFIVHNRKRISGFTK